MARSAPRAGKQWSANEIKVLTTLAAGNTPTPTRLIAYKLGRTVDGVYSKASAEGVSLQPTNQSPDNRRK